MDSGDAVPAPVAATKGEDEFGKVSLLTRAP